MKEYIIDQFVDNIVAHSGLSKEDIFENSRKSEYADARKFLYKLCVDRGVSVKKVQSYMIKKGFNCYTSTIHQGLSSLDKMMEKDSDLGIILNKLSHVEV